MNKQKSSEVEKAFFGISAVVVFILFSWQAGFVNAQKAIQSGDTGVTPGKSYSISDIETISMFSGNLMLNVPLGSLPAGRGGLSGGIGLQYNSKIWEMHTIDALDRWGNEAENNTLHISEEGGWNYGYKYYLKADWTPGHGDCQSSEGFYQQKIQLVMPDGGKHTLIAGNVGDTDYDGYSNIYPDGRNTCVASTITPGQKIVFFTNDNTFLRLEVIADSDTDWTNNVWSLYMPDGTRVIYDPSENFAQRIIDRNGNYLDIIETAVDGNYSGHKTVYLIDQLQRKVVIEYAGATDEDWIHSKGVNGADVTTRVKWKNISVNKIYRMGDYTAPSPHPPDYYRNFPLNRGMRVVDKIYLPSQNTDNLYYEFQYNVDTTTAIDVGWGEISQVRLPSEATSDYEYKYDNVSGNLIDGGMVLRNRPSEKTLTYDLEYDGTVTQTSETWTYQTTGYYPDSSTITSPVGGTTTEYYGTSEPSPPTAPSFFPHEVYKTETADGTVNENWYQNNALGAPTSPGYPNLRSEANRYIKYQFVSIRTAAGTLTKTAIKEYSHDKNGNITQVKEYDFVPYSSVPRNSEGRPYAIPSGLTPVRITKTAYYNDTPDASSANYTDPDSYHLASSPKLLRLPKSIEVQDGTGTPKSRSETAYDYTNYTTNTKAGNPTESKSWDSFKNGTNQPYSNPLTTSNSVSTSAQYDGYGNPTLTTDAKGNQTQITYGLINGYTGLYPTQTISAHGTAIQRTSTAQYDFSTGLISTMTDVDNNISSGTEYDALGRPIKVKSAVGTTLETWTQTEYNDAERRVIVRSDLFTIGDGKKVAVQHYDQLSRVRLSRSIENIATEDPYNEADGIKVQTRYLTGNPNSYQLVSNPYRAATSSAATGEQSMGWTRSKSWNTGRKQEVETFSGATLPAPWGSNASSTGVVTTDIDANSTTVTDQAGKLRRSITNALGQLTRVDEPNAAGQLGTVASPNQPTSYAYDTLNNLTTVNQGVQTRTFSYSSLSRLLTATNPESGTISYQYDANGNLTSKSDARTITTTYTYDALNRVAFRNYSETTPDVTYTYGTAAPAIGKLTKVESSVSTTEYTSFDTLGRVTAHKQTTDGTAYTTGYVYNLSGALIEKTYPSGRVVKNVLNNDGDLSIVQSKKNSNSGYFNYAKNFSYTSAAAISSMQLGNGKWESTQYNSRLQPTQIALGTVQNGFDKLKLEYGYGTTANNGNVLSQKITVKRPSQSDLIFDQTFSYDSLNRITSAEEKTGVTTNWMQVYTFDRYGNRNFNESLTTTLPKNCGTSPNFTVCPADVPVVNPSANAGNNRLNGTTYDAAGNVIVDAEGRQFTYDAENKQIEAENASEVEIGTYFFDGDGKRVKKVVPSTGEVTIFVYDAGSKLVAEYSTIVEPVQTAKVQYLTADNLGTPRINTDKDGNVTSRSDYMPYGEEIIGLGNRTSGDQYVVDDVRQGFTGYINDSETGLDFAQARMYSNSHGRFTSSDPLYFQLSMAIDPQMLNLYLYCRNAPTKWKDPTGEKLRLSGDSQFLYRMLEAMAGGGETFDTYFQIVGGEVRLRSGVDTSNVNSGVQLLLDLVNAQETYLYFAGGNGEGVADLFQGSRDRKGKLTNSGRQIRDRFDGSETNSGGGSVFGTTGRSGSNQPANLANGDPVFFVLALNVHMEQTQIGISRQYVDIPAGTITALDVQLAGLGQRIRPESIAIHESAENLEFARMTPAERSSNWGYPVAHTAAMNREAKIKRDLKIAGGFAGGYLQTFVKKPKK